MAKKKVDLEEDDFEKEILEEEAVVEEVEDDAVDDEEATVAHKSGADDVDVAEDAGVEEVAVEEEPSYGEPDEPEEEEEEEPAPRGKNTGLTVALCVLNALAAIGFAFLLLLDYQKRQEWSYGVFLHELFLQGLPLKLESDGISASRATLPRMKLDGGQINAAASGRGVKGSGEFVAVDEPLTSRIQPDHMSPEVLKDYFGSQGAEVATLEDEVLRLKDKVPADIAQVARDAVAAFKGKNDQAKRDYAAGVYLPLAYDIYQVEAIDKKLKAAKGTDLDDWIADALERRLLVDILAPHEIFRPGDATAFFLEKVADRDVFKLDEVRKRLEKRFAVAIADKYDGSVHLGKEWDNEARHSWEKRQTIGFLLIAIASVQKPGLAKPTQTSPLYPEGGAPGTPNLLRAQTVLGLHEFAAAAQNLPVAWKKLTERVVDAIHVDRQGFDILYKDKGGKERPERNLAFVDKHDAEIRRILDLKIEIKKAQNRLQDLQEQHQKVKKTVEDRTLQLKEATQKLIESRVLTAKVLTELRALQQQLYRAQAELRDADEINTRLLQGILAEERKARGLKGEGTP